MRVFKTRAFARFQTRENIAETRLVEAMRNVENGLIDADLGGGLIKVRIAREGGGKRGGYRTLIAYSRENRAVFLFVFAKSERANIDQSELKALRKLGRTLLESSDSQLAATVNAGELQELVYEP